MAKTPCPIERAEFLQKAKSITLTIGSQQVTADAREFSTGSFGWYFTGKVSLEVDGKKIPVQVGCNLTVVGSKDTPR